MTAEMPETQGRPSTPRRPRRVADAGLVIFAGLMLVAYALLHLGLGNRIGGLLGWHRTCLALCDVSIRGQIEVQASAVLLVASALVAGWAVASVLRLREMERPLVFGLLAFAFVSVPAAAVGGIGDAVGRHLLEPPYGPILSAVPAIVAIGLAIRRGWWPSWPKPRSWHVTPLVAVLAIAAGGLIVLSAAVVLHHPPNSFDELSYHLPLSVFMWQDGTLSQFLDRFPGTWILAHPGSAELWFGILREMGGEPPAVLGQLPFALIGAVGVTVFGRRLGLPRAAAVIGGLAFLLAPMIAIQVGHEVNDVVAATLIIGIAALVAAPAHEWTMGRIALVGLLLGIATATKLALLPEVFALGLFAAVSVVVFARRGPDRPRLPVDRRGLIIGIGIAITLFALAVGPWWLRNLARFGNPLYPTDLPLYGHGISQAIMDPKDRVYVPNRLLWPLFLLFEPHRQDSGFGALLAIAIVPGGIIAAFRARRRPLLLLIVLLAISLPLWWLETRHQPRLLPGILGLLCALIPFVLVGLRGAWRTWAAVVLAIAAIASVGITVTSALAIDAARPVDRVTLYDSGSHADRLALLLPEANGILLDDCGTANPLYPYLGAGQTRPVARIKCHATTAQVLAAMHRYGLSYVEAVSQPGGTAPFDARYPSDLFELVTPSGADSAHPPRPYQRLYHLRANVPTASH